MILPQPAWGLSRYSPASWCLWLCSAGEACWTLGCPQQLLLPCSPHWTTCTLRLLRHQPRHHLTPWADQLLVMKLPQLPLRLEEARGWKTAGFGHHQTGVVSHHHPPWQLRQQGGGGVL